MKNPKTQFILKARTDYKDCDRHFGREGAFFQLSLAIERDEREMRRFQ